MTKFAPAYIAMCRKAKGGVWVFPEAKRALDEIEKSHDMIERLIKAGKSTVTVCFGESHINSSARKEFFDLVDEWQA